MTYPYRYPELNLAPFLAVLLERRWAVPVNVIPELVAAGFPDFVVLRFSGDCAHCAAEAAGTPCPDDWEAIIQREVEVLKARAASRFAGLFGASSSPGTVH